MADIVRRESTREAVSLREAMDRLFNESFLRPWGDWGLTRGAVQPIPIDMYETEKDVVVKASLPGMKPEDLQISVTGDVLTIQGELKSEQEVKRENYHLQEHRYGSFSRSVQLPADVNTDHADASFENGVLTLTLPKAEAAQAKQIRVKPRQEQLNPL